MPKASPDFEALALNPLVYGLRLLFLITMEWDIILHVEDDDSYALMMECVLRKVGFNHRIQHLSSAAEAKAYLNGEGEYRDRELYPLPGLILADLKMPGTSGLELLKWVRSQSCSSRIPFVILTSSDDLKEITEAYQLGANSFLMKPPSVPDLVEMMKAVEIFWMKQKFSN